MFSKPSFKELETLQSSVRVLEASQQPIDSAWEIIRRYYPKSDDNIENPDLMSRLGRLAAAATSALEYSEPRLTDLYNASAMGEVSERLMTMSSQDQGLDEVNHHHSDDDDGSESDAIRVAWIESQDNCVCGEDLGLGDETSTSVSHLFSLGFVDRFCGFRAGSDMDSRWLRALQAIGLERMHRRCVG